MDAKDFLQRNSKISVAVLCGGPSLERGISLNSARSILDHLGSQGVEIVPIYFNEQKKPFKISISQLYSNTPSDFDFKLGNKSELSQAGLIRLLKSVSIVFPCIHGSFGEDGEIQSFLEKNNIPFIGSGSKSCNKHKANEYIRKLGFFSPKSIVLKITDTKKTIESKVHEFWKAEKMTRAIIKPAAGGSSIGVFSVESVKDAVQSVETLFSKRMDTRVVMERFAEGKEFTVIILQNKFGRPAAILPTEMELEYTENQFFDFRKKYLPTRHVTYHCPPGFSNQIIEKIQIVAEQLFSIFGMRDFARFDGFFLPDGNIWFSDFNPISGMEQNSFLFQQASRIGFSHQDLFRYILNSAFARRHMPELVHNIFLSDNQETFFGGRKPVAVLFGGETAEKQVSLMSGTNVWLKLRGSGIYEPHPYLFVNTKEVWELPYSYILNHTVEEIIQNAKNAEKNVERLSFLVEKARIKLRLGNDDTTEEFFVPRKHNLDHVLKEYPFVFLGLHGGIGEDGTLQKILKLKKVKFNGSGTVVSKLCMDKWETNETIRKAKIPGVAVAEHALFEINDVPNNADDSLTQAHWEMLLKRLGTKTIIGKPRGDGCSAGVVRLFNKKDLATYVSLIKNKVPIAKAGTFTNQVNNIDMPEGKLQDIIFESFIETDKLKVSAGKITHVPKSGYVEMTVGVFEDKGKVRSLSPSITIAEDTILSVEEKFQGGTGVNITPPPKEIISTNNLNKVKSSIEAVAKKIGIKGYARIDIFAHVKTGNIIVIEINTLPGLTPSTVIYHQALAEKTPMYPKEFLEHLIKNKGY